MGQKAKLIFLAFLTTLCLGVGWAVAPLAHADNAISQSEMIRLDSPRPNDQLASGMVEVRYQRLEESAAQPNPNTFRIQLDSEDPISTEHTTCVLTGVTPGHHTVSVSLLDAGGTPVPHSVVSASFTVLPAAYRQDSGALVASQAPPPPSEGHNPNSRALPILSIIGFGVLVGGIFSAMRTR